MILEPGIFVDFLPGKGSWRLVLHLCADLMDSVWCPHRALHTAPHGRALHTPQPMCLTLTVPLSLSSWGPGWEQFSMTLGSERLGEDESCAHLECTHLLGLEQSSRTTRTTIRRILPAFPKEGPPMSCPIQFLLLISKFFFHNGKLICKKGGHPGRRLSFFL